MFLLLFIPFLLFAGVIENNITAVYKQTFQDIKIENLSLQYYGKKFKDKIKFVDTSSINPKQPQGMIKINNIKYVYFRMSAKIKVLKSIKVIAKNQFIDRNNSKIVWVPLKNFHKMPLKKIPTNSVARMYIPNNHLIYQYMLTNPTLIKKYSPIKIISRNGGIEITFDGTAIENGKKGDIIKVKDKENHIYKVKIDKNGNGIL